jgi:hypothetical protein
MKHFTYKNKIHYIKPITTTHITYANTPIRTIHSHPHSLTQSTKKEHMRFYNIASMYDICDITTDALI